MKYKKSRYNFFVPYTNSKIIIYNTLSGSIGTFDYSTYERYQLNTLTEEEQLVLNNKGILIEAKYDELASINQDRIGSINRSNYKNLRIWTTTMCNANCRYCFEKEIHPCYMTKDVADSTLRYIKSTLSSDDTIEVCWFGGEPLMNSDIITYMTPKLIKICQERKSHYRFSMISNGSLITEEIADKFKNEWNIGFIQITLDGYGADYDAIKNYSNSEKYRFQRIINNIKLLASRNIKISIRMNYDTYNYESLKTLILFLSKELKKFKLIRYYVYPVWSSCSQNDSSSYYTSTKCDSNLIALYDLLVELKMATMRQVARLGYRKNQCMACNKSSYSIMPNGELIKCCESYSSIIGNVYHGIMNYNEYNAWTFEDLNDDCENCVLLPICQGGCRAGYLGSMERCIVTKDILPDILKWYVKRKEKETDCAPKNS